MQILIFYPQHLSDTDKEAGRHLLSSFPANQILLRMIKTYSPFSNASCRIVIPEIWKSPQLQNENEDSVFVSASENWTSRFPMVPGVSSGSEVIISNAQILTEVDLKWLETLISTFPWDVLAIRVDPGLAGCREQVKLTRLQHIVGFRRQYQPSAEPDVSSEHWPDHLFCKPGIWPQLRQEGMWRSYPAFLERCQKAGVNYRFIQVGGRRLDLFSSAGQMQLLEFSQTYPGDGSPNKPASDASVRIYGTVHIGRNVKMGPGAVIVAPAILCDGSEIGANALIRKVFVGASVHIPDNSRIQRQVLLPSSGSPQKTVLPLSAPVWEAAGTEDMVYRDWPLFSYARCGKRAFDLVVSLCIVVLFIPFFPVIALAIKLTSSGSIFYRARRQGLHGKEFNCLKFRTMLEQAESMQEQLRIVNQVDGPQFKIEDDPRTSPIGKFLRDTCIDELPQFLNVLAGQMSVVGPRPSPEDENEFCPAWRDARLSVRPGITGLWQVCRTRETSMDFQEWIYYDTEYVRRLSWRMDLWICFKTARKLIVSFLDQFG